MLLFYRFDKLFTKSCKKGGTIFCHHLTHHLARRFQSLSTFKGQLLYGPRREKTCLRWFENNKGADQPAHPRSLISAFIIRLLESIISKLASRGISIFLLVTIAEETCLSLALSVTPKTGFVPTRPILYKSD